MGDRINVAELIVRWLQGESLADIHPRAEDAMRRVVAETTEAHVGVLACIGLAAHGLEESALEQHDVAHGSEYMRGYTLGEVSGKLAAVRVLMRIYQWSHSRVAHD